MSFYQKQDSLDNPYCVPAGYCASNDECDVKLICKFGECVTPIQGPTPAARLGKNGDEATGLSSVWIAVIVIGVIAIVAAIGFVVYKKIR